MVTWWGAQRKRTFRLMTGKKPEGKNGVLKDCLNAQDITFCIQGKQIIKHIYQENVPKWYERVPLGGKIIVIYTSPLYIPLFSNENMLPLLLRQ